MKKKLKAWKIFHIFDEIYKQNIWLCYDVLDIKQLIKYLNKETKEDFTHHISDDSTTAASTFL